jgi:hypothetical protein
MMRARVAAVAALAACALAGGRAEAATSRDALIARWVDASTGSIASIHDPKARRAAQQQFDRTRARLDDGSAASPAPGDLSALAARELAKPGRYQLSVAPQVPPHQSIWEQVWNWLRDRVAEIWNALFSRANISPGGAAAIGWVLTIVASAVFVIVTVSLLLRVQFDRRRAGGVLEALDAAPDAQALYRLASEAAQRGEYALAARLLFAATVAALGLRGAVRDDASATVGDLRRALRSRDASLVSPFDSVAAPFVASAYAERPVRADEWERAHEAYLTLAPPKSPA